MTYKPTRYEQETIISFNQEESTATVYTHNSSCMRKLGSLSNEFPEFFSLKCEDEFSKTFIIPKKCISLRKPTVLSDETKERLRLNMKNVKSAA